MTLRAAPLAAIGIAAYAVFAAATMPARVALGEAQSRAPDRLRVHEAHGTLWHGAARVEVAAGPSWIALDNLAWRWRPAALLQGRLAFDVDAQALGGMAQGVVGRSPAAWHASGRATLPATSAAMAMPLLSTWRPEGTLALTADDLAWNDTKIRGGAIAEWRDAALALSAVRPLGSYRATLEADGAAGKLAVATLSGPLRIEGGGDLAFPGGLTFQGQARAEPAQAAALDPLLDLLGPRRPDGARTLAWRTR